MSIPAGTKFMVVSSDSDTTDKRSARIQTESEYVTIEEILAESQSKWKVYKALLSQADEDDPVAVVLNQDDADFLGNIVWTFDDPDCVGTLSDAFTVGLTTHLPVSTGATLLEFAQTNKDVIRINDSTDLSGMYVEIRVRLRGEAPLLLSAETNLYGDKLVLTFDKEMCGDGVNDAWTTDDDIIMSLTGGSASVLSANVNSDNKCLIECYFDANKILYDDEPDVSISKDIIRSLDFGLYEGTDHLPVVNNVVKPPEFVSAETNTAGDEIIITFDKNMLPPIEDDSNLAFTLVIDSNPKSIGSIRKGEDPTTLILYDLEESIHNGDSVTIERAKEICIYPIRSFDQGYFWVMSQETVTNNVPA